MVVVLCFTLVCCDGLELDLVLQPELTVGWSRAAMKAAGKDREGRLAIEAMMKMEMAVDGFLLWSQCCLGLQVAWTAGGSLPVDASDPGSLADRHCGCLTRQSLRASVDADA
eukprot:1735514-Rhodomonas_salina.2